ncbi:hypothetical protein HDU89_006328 [Geranomyces variabilis]|nr:hypothetical protein HDU89_006328 [Geranomyces variabilis]
MLAAPNPSALGPWSDNDNIAMHTSEMCESLQQLHQQSTVLLLGAMGAGRSSLREALRRRVLTDPHIKDGEFDVRVALKEPRQFMDDFRASCAAQDQETLFYDNGVGEQLGAPDPTFMLRALHPECFDPTQKQAERAMLQFITDAATGEEPVLPPLPNDATVQTALAPQMYRVTLTAGNQVQALLNRVCRAHSTDPASIAIVDATPPDLAFAPLQKLLALSKIWLLVRLVSVSANVQSRGVLPPFLHLLDSPGLGSEDLTGNDVLASIQACVHHRTVTQNVRFMYTKCDEASATQLKGLTATVAA